MISHPDTIDRLITDLQRFKAAGATHVGTERRDRLNKLETLDTLLTLDLVYLSRETLEIVGDEANDYKHDPATEIVAVRIQ